MRLSTAAASARSDQSSRAGSSRARAPRRPAASRVEPLHRAPRARAARCCPPPRSRRRRCAAWCAGERGHGGLAVGAGDREQRVAPRAPRDDQAKSSMSPTTGEPARERLAGRPASSSDRPGLDATRSTPSSSAGVNAPVVQSRPAPRLAARQRGGAARVSATRTVPPWRATQRATESPVSPSPSTSTRLPSARPGVRQRRRRFAHHRA